MEGLIQKAIEINSTTILPNFGAFMKMGKSVLFNEFLKYDDGKLAAFIVESENVTEDEAKQKIATWIQSANTKLDAGEKITIVNIGELTREGGKLKFVAIAGSEKTKDSVPEVETKKEEVVKPITTPVMKKVEEVKKEEIVEEIKEVKKEVVKPATKVVNLSTDFSAQDAIDKIKNFENKNDLISFTRGDKRKTVIDALNKRLDALNGKTVSLENPKEEPEMVNQQLEKTSIPELELEKEVKKVPEKELENTAIPEQSKIKEEVKKPEVVSKEEKTTPIPEVKKVETEKTKVATPPKVEEKKKEKNKIDDEAIAAIASGVEKTEKQLKKRKRRKLILWLALICLLIGGAVIGFLKKDLIIAFFEKKHEPKELADNTEKHKEEDQKEASNNDDATQEVTNAKEEETEEVVETVETDEVKEEIVAEPETIVEPVEEIEKPADSHSSSKGNYHIVAGSFSSKENANNKVNSLKEKGYSSAKVLGQYGGLYTVRAMSFNSISEAKAALVNFKAEGNKGFVKKL